MSEVAHDVEEIKVNLRKMFEERLNIDISELDVDDDSLLFSEDDWGIDSVDVIDIVLGIEQIYGIKIKQDSEVQKQFKSVNTLSAYIANSL